MTIKEKIDEIVTRFKNDKNFANDFKSDPVKAIESIIGVDLPNDVIENIISGVKAKITTEKAENLLDGLKKMF